MKALMKLKILNSIRIYGPISRTTISKNLQISMTAVTVYISQLIKENFIEEIGTEESKGGRKPILLKVKKDTGYVIGIDFGQGYFRIGLGDLDGNIIYKEKILSKQLGDKNTGIDIIIKMIEEIIEKNITDKNKLKGISIALSAIIDINRGFCYTIPNLKGWENVDIVEIFEERFKIPVYIDDSTRLAALAESASVKGRIKDLAYINIGVGIGAGIIIDWKLLKGENGIAGELGHIIVEENGLQCGCGNKGCLEQYIATPSLIRRVKDSIKDGVQSVIIAKANNNIELIDTKIIAEAVEERDKLALNIVLDAGKYLGIGLSHIVTLFNPKLIIIGGGGINISDYIIEEAIKICNIRSVNQAVKNVKIVKSSLGEYSTLMGAITMFLDYYFGLNDVINESIFNLGNAEDV